VETVTDSPPNADSGRVINVVGRPDKDEFWWICRGCGENSYHQRTAPVAYGLALGHAAWHAWDRDSVVIGWPGEPLAPNGSSAGGGDDAR
jgi:hypothetical protein